MVDKMLLTDPILYNTQKSSKASEKYGLVRTIDVVEQLQQYGYEPYLLNRSTNDLGVHFVSLKNEEDDILTVINSYDRSKKLQILKGKYRSVCSNSLIRPAHLNNGALASNSLGLVITHLIWQTGEAKSHIEQYLGQEDHDMVEDAKHVYLDLEQTYFVAEKMAKVRHQKPTKVALDGIISPKRSEDMATDLWTVANVVEESLRKGGYQEEFFNGGKPYRMEMPEISNPKRVLEISAVMYETIAEVLENV